MARIFRHERGTGKKPRSPANSSRFKPYRPNKNTSGFTWPYNERKKQALCLKVVSKWRVFVPHLNIQTCLHFSYALQPGPLGHLSYRLQKAWLATKEWSHQRDHFISCNSVITLCSNRFCQNVTFPTNQLFEFLFHVCFLVLLCHSLQVSFCIDLTPRGVLGSHLRTTEMLLHKR